MALALRPTTLASGALAIVVGATALRLVYALFVMDPMSGPDAPTYHEIAVAFAREGLLTEGAGDLLPHYPPGYPLIVGIVYRLFGFQPRLVTALQVVVLGAATWVAFRLVARELNERVGLATVALVSLSPALLALPAQLMYETFLLAGMVVGFDLLSRSLRPDGGALQAVGAMAVLGVTSTLQGKVILTGLVAVALVAWRRRSAAVAVAGVAALAAGPLAAGFRTYLAEGQFAVSSTGQALLAGFNDAATGGYVNPVVPEGCEPPADIFGRDRVVTGCALEWALDHPGRSAVLTVHKPLFLWSPMVGPLTHRGTWFHAFDVRRVLPGDGASADSLVAFATAAWSALSALTVLIGLWLAWRQPGWTRGAALLAVPPLTFLLVAVLTYGDARHRLPVAPFYSAFQAVTLVAVAERVARRVTAGRRPAEERVPA